MIDFWRHHGEQVVNISPTLPPRTLTNSFKFDAFGGRSVSRPISRVLSRRFPALDGHSSGTFIAECFARPTRAVSRKQPWAFAHTTPIRSCSRWGLPGHNRCRPCGALLPHRFTLAADESVSGLFLWHFPWGRPRRVLPGTVFPWSPDFPPLHPFGPRKSGHPAD